MANLLISSTGICQKFYSEENMKSKHAPHTTEGVVTDCKDVGFEHKQWLQFVLCLHQRLREWTQEQPEGLLHAHRGDSWSEGWAGVGSLA